MGLFDKAKEALNNDDFKNKAESAFKSFSNKSGNGDNNNS